MPEAIAPELTIRYSCAMEVKLIDERAHAFLIDAAARGDQAGSDFNDQAHV